MAFAEIRQALIDKLNTPGVKNIKAAYRTDRSEISAYPAALVIPSDNEAEYHETSPGSNRDIFNFTIRILYPFVEGQETADLALEAAVDELLELFHSRNVLGSVCDWVTPVPSTWGYQDRPNGTFRVAELRIKAVKHVDGGS